MFPFYPGSNQLNRMITAVFAFHNLVQNWAQSTELSASLGFTFFSLSGFTVILNVHSWTSLVLCFGNAMPADWNFTQWLFVPCTSKGLNEWVWMLNTAGLAVVLISKRCVLSYQKAMLCCTMLQHGGSCPYVCGVVLSIRSIHRSLKIEQHKIQQHLCIMDSIVYLIPSMLQLS